MTTSMSAVALLACVTWLLPGATAPALAQADVASAARAAPAEPEAPPTAERAAQDEEEDEIDSNLTEADFSIVTLPTTLQLPRFGFNFRLTHRFLANLRQGSFTDHLEDLFGLDNGAVIALELRFAPLDNLQVVVHRSSQDKTLQFSGQYDAIRQGRAWPVSISPIASIEGTNNFKGRGDTGGDDHGHDHAGGGGAHRSPALGAVVSRTLGDRLALYAVPMWVHDSARLPEGDRNTGFLGLGGRARLSRNVFVVAEVSPRIGGYAPGSPGYAFGIERRAGGHMFLLTFTNSVGTTFGQVSQGGFPDTLYMGFNLGRKFY
jgi:hypothetical protein